MKKKILSLLAVVMAAMTASAYTLTVGTNAHGTVTFKVNNQTVNEAAEGDVVTMTITPKNGWSVYETEGVWVAAIAKVQAQNATIPVSRDVELTPVSGQTNTWTFTMKRANAYFSISYKRVIQTSWISNISSTTYDGQEKRPEPIVRVNGTGATLTPGTDYTVEYDNNIYAGTATVTVTINPESELYEGSATKKFTIKKRSVTLTTGSMTREYNGTPLTNSEVEGKNANGLIEETGWADGEGATYEFTASQLLVGYSDNTLKYTLKDNTKYRNYQITINMGLLTITPKTIALAETEDNSELLEDNDGVEANVTLTRTLQPGYWNTFAVPFALSGDELEAWGITAKELTGSSFFDGELTLNFENAESIEAGKPYLVKVEEAVENPTFEDVIMKKDAVAVETDAVDFVPSLGKTLVTGSEGNESNTQSVLFLGAGNQLINPSVVNDPDNLSSYIKGFRAFFQLKGDADLAKFRLEFDGGTVTEIVELKDSNIEELNSDDCWYDLSGRKLDGQPTTKGVYIWKGQKVVVK